MADNRFSTVIEGMFKSMNAFMSSKTVVGEPIVVDKDTFVIPLVDVSIGVGAGANVNDHKNKDLGGGGMSMKMNPSAVLVVQEGVARIINIQENDKLLHFIESAPDTVNRVATMLKKNNKTKKVDAAVESAFDDLEI
ncbi:MAG: sporulation protein [Lachnospiraceae bacterium]|nr:sporulation protein [Lachnospiraceae bacterium]